MAVPSNAPYPNYQLRTFEILPLFGLKPSSPIPPDFWAKLEIEHGKFSGIYEILPQAAKGRGRHRVRFHCTCGKSIPAGRIMQHQKGHECKFLTWAKQPVEYARDQHPDYGLKS